MRIDIWSDVVCPWCWIGKRRLQRGIALLGERVPAFEIHWHPYLLDPEAGTMPMPLRELYHTKFGGVERTNQILASTQKTAREEGLPIDFDRGQVRVTTLPAHRLLWLAAREGDSEATLEALFHAHFAEGRNLAEPAVLMDAGEAGRLPRGRVAALFASDEGLAQVRGAIDRAQAMGIRAVPSFVLGGQRLVQGAQPPEALAAALQQVMASRASAA